MKRGTLWIVFVALVVWSSAGCGSSSKKPLTVTISMAPTTLAVNSTGNVVATVTNDPANNGVIWTCTPAIACGSFSFVPSSTQSGASSVFTAPPAIPSGGSVTITATSLTNGSVVSAPVTVTITAGTTVATNNFVFYASGEQNATDTEITYSIAGVVAIASTASADGSFAVISGEQDYNDGILLTSPQPTGDFITGGSLVFTNGAGQATLTLITNNPSIGNSGTEVFALAFANDDHALIVQFDGSATSSGSYDFQSSTTAPVSTSFAFTASGLDASLSIEGGCSNLPIAEAGVFALDASSNLTGTLDVNDAGVPTLGTAITGALGVADSLGRGAIMGSGIGNSANYYVVGPEVLRLVDADAGSCDTSVGSAYGQGAAGTTPLFSAASIGTSVFSVAGNNVDQFAAAGQFTTDGVSTFRGVGDENESLSIGSAPVLAGGFGGTYAVNASGYGNFTFGNADGLGSMLVLGVYAVAPALNILDPNNTTNTVGEGGALFAEMDANLVGTGVLIPQTDTALTALAGPFVFGAQGDGTAESTVGPPPVTVIDEFDFVGEGAIAGGAFTGTGVLSDPFGSLTATSVQSTNAAFSASFVDDLEGIGRSTSNLQVSATFTPPATPDFPTVTLAVTVYEANAGQAFWIDTDDLTDVFAGSIQSNTGVTAAVKKRLQARTTNQKH